MTTVICTVTMRVKVTFAIQHEKYDKTLNIDVQRRIIITYLLNVAIGCFPHVVIFYDALQRLPRQLRQRQSRELHQLRLPHPFYHMFQGCCKTQMYQPTLRWDPYIAAAAAVAATADKRRGCLLSC